MKTGGVETLKSIFLLKKYQVEVGLPEFWEVAVALVRDVGLTDKSPCSLQISDMNTLSIDKRGSCY